MSYWVSLYVDGGGTAMTEAWSENMTSNVAPMWRAAGIDLAEHDLGQTLALELVLPLRRAVADMCANPSRYNAMNPANGWGSRADCVRFLSSLLDACEDYPAARVIVSH